MYSASSAVGEAFPATTSRTVSSPPETASWRQSIGSWRRAMNVESFSAGSDERRTSLDPDELRLEFSRAISKAFQPPKGPGDTPPRLRGTGRRELNDRLKTFVIVEVRNGHQYVGQWKCSDIVHLVNSFSNSTSSSAGLIRANLAPEKVNTTGNDGDGRCGSFNKTWILGPEANSRGEGNGCCSSSPEENILVDGPCRNGFVETEDAVVVKDEAQSSYDATGRLPKLASNLLSVSTPDLHVSSTSSSMDSWGVRSRGRRNSNQSLRAPRLLSMGNRRAANRPVLSTTRRTRGAWLSSARSRSAAQHTDQHKGTSASIQDNTQVRNGSRQQGKFAKQVHHYYHFFPSSAAPGLRKYSARSFAARSSFVGADVGATPFHLPRTSSIRGSPVGGASKDVSQLTYRDLRQVFTDGSPLPSIEVRRNCIVLCFPPLSCIVMADRVFLLVVENLVMDGLIAGIEELQLRDMHRRRATSTWAAVPPVPSKGFDSSASPASGNQVYDDSSGASLPLEFSTIELVLTSVFEQLDGDIKHFEKRFEEISASLARDGRVTSVGEQLHYLKQLAAPYTSRVALFDKALDELLANPEDLVNMELTRRVKEDNCYTNSSDCINSSSTLPVPGRKQQPATGFNGSPYAADRLPNFQWASLEDPFKMKRFDCGKSGIATMNLWPAIDSREPDPDLEILLEFFDQENEMFRHRLTRLSEGIENLERLIQFRLSLKRNTLLLWDVACTVAGIGIAIGTCVSGIFGMNMQSGLEYSYVGFTATSISIAVFVIVYLFSVLVLIRNVNL